MRLYSYSFRFLFAALLPLAMVLVVRPTVALSQDDEASAPPVIAWRFAPQEVLSVTLEESSSVRSTTNTIANLNETQITLSMSWEVISVENSVATISQTLDRIAMTLNTRTDDKTNKVEFDTAVESPKLKGAAERTRRQLEALVGITVTVRMKTTGEIVGVDVDDAALEKIRQAPSSTIAREMFSPDGIRSLFQQTGLVLPDKSLATGDKWHDTHEIAGEFGRHQVTRRYELVGNESVGGRPTHKIALKSELGSEIKPATPAQTTVPGDPYAPPKLTGFSQTGTFSFDQQAGVFSDSQVQTRMDTVGQYREMAIETQIQKTARLRINRK